jgi:adenine nucleotide transporter 17
MSNTLSNFLFFFFRSFLIEKIRLRKASSSGSTASNGKERGSDSKGITLSAAEDLAAGMLAGMASRFFTTPLSNVTVRHQTSSVAKQAEEGKGKGKSVEDSDSSDDDGEYSDEPGIVETLQQIVAEKGVAGE